MANKINNYIEVFPEIFDEFKNKNNKKISKYKANGLPKGYRAYYRGLEESFKTIGIGEIILNKDEIFVSNRLYSIKYIILNKYDEAKSCVNKIHNIANEKYMKPFLNYEDIFTSILVKDEEMLNKALNNLCKNNSKLKYYKDTPEGLICIEGLGLAKLAILKGMNVKLDDSVQGREMLETSEFEYPIVDFVD